MFFLLNFDLLEMLLSMCTTSIKALWDGPCAAIKGYQPLTEQLTRCQVTEKPTQSSVLLSDSVYNILIKLHVFSFLLDT